MYVVCSITPLRRKNATKNGVLGGCFFFGTIRICVLCDFLMDIFLNKVIHKCLITWSKSKYWTEIIDLYIIKYSQLWIFSNYFDYNTIEFDRWTVDVIGIAYLMSMRGDNQIYEISSFLNIFEASGEKQFSRHKVFSCVLRTCKPCHKCNYQW